MINKFLKYLNDNYYSKNTQLTYKSVLYQYLDKIDDIKKIKTKIISYKDSPNTCHLHYNVLNSFLNWSKDNRIEYLNQIKLPQLSLKYMEVFSKKFLESKIIINEWDSKEIINKKYTIKFLFETGIRAEELSSICNAKKETIEVLGKGNKKREVFYNKNTLNNMKPFIYTSKTLRTWVKEILGSEFTPHSIRRSFATHMLVNGANIKMVMMQLGHSKIETTYRYLHLNLQENAKQYKLFF